MKAILLSIISLGFLLPLAASAETEEEEMARIQRELNRQLFAPEDKPEPPPPPVMVPAPAPMVAAPSPAPADATLPLTTFTGYQLVGVSLGMAKSDVVSKLQAEGYTCNSPQMKGMLQMMGRNICFYASMEAPKIVMFTLKNGQVRDFELHETYKSGFPEEIFKRAKKSFMNKYGDQAKCKNQRKGEVCEIFGHGYRIVLRSEIDSGEEAKIIRSVHTL